MATSTVKKEISITNPHIIPNYYSCINNISSKEISLLNKYINTFIKYGIYCKPSFNDSYPSYLILQLNIPCTNHSIILYCTPKSVNSCIINIYNTYNFNMFSNYDMSTLLNYSETEISENYNPVINNIISEADTYIRELFSDTYNISKENKEFQLTKILKNIKSELITILSKIKNEETELNNLINNITTNI